MTVGARPKILALIVSNTSNGRLSLCPLQDKCPASVDDFGVRSREGQPCTHEGAYYMLQRAWHDILLLVYTDSPSTPAQKQTAEDGFHHEMGRIPPKVKQSANKSSSWVPVSFLLMVTVLLCGLQPCLDLAGDNCTIRCAMFRSSCGESDSCHWTKSPAVYCGKLSTSATRPLL